MADKAIPWGGEQIRVFDNGDSTHNLAVRWGGYLDRLKALSPIALWPLDEASGTVAYDRSGNGRNGAYTGVTFNVPGAEVVVNGAFTVDSGWTKPAGWSIGSGVATHAAAGGTGALNQSPLIVGQAYTLTYTVKTTTAGTVTGKLGVTALTTQSANGTYTESGVCTGDQALRFTPTNDFDGSIDDVSVVATSANGIGDGRNAPYFDGVNDYCNVYGASLAAAFNGAEGSIAGWLRVTNVGVWTDAAVRFALALGNAANTNRVNIVKLANNQITVRHTGGGTTKTINFATSSTGWLHLALTWSVAANQVSGYLNGTRSDAAAGIGVWNGSLENSFTNLGAYSSTPGNPWSGTLAHMAVWARALSPAEVLGIGTPL